MNFIERVKRGTITIEVRAFIPEKFINLLWSQGIYASNIKKIDLTTFLVDIDLNDLKNIDKIAKRAGAKYKVVGKKGLAFYIIRAKRQLSLVIGALLFIGVMFYLSTYIWGIEINTKKVLSPFEVRRQLDKLGIKPGIKKTALNVYSLEKQIEDSNGEIMWVRARIEGSTLKIDIEEKTNPPILRNENQNGGVVAKEDGVIERIYTISGKPMVKSGDVVKKGDLLIAPTQGKEGFEYTVKAEGQVLANTFYEKDVEVQVSGKIKERSGNKQNALYFECLGKKIYIKKPIKNYVDYDKIEFTGNLIKGETYYEINEKEIALDVEKVKKETVDKARETVLKEIDKDAKITQEMVNVENEEEGKVIIKAIFVVKQDIAVTNSQT
ncbi:sporulation protein YqfD [Clostridium paridis]|uniref:Sporulation protein YqfD n=1 Tax=Clostridium paridis TaxID=2803863 RepID=A0A937FIX4_9CLOT|nr:sporulation protein YqfD [Clostridium paridis]MBL4933003.1 sporulation protein YqfD [Clostridium paridis]